MVLGLSGFLDICGALLTSGFSSSGRHALLIWIVAQH